jgi:ubiquitin-like 1-activating enzyme E1 B
VIDLDTIDISNLNRQLLFRSQHVGMPKCTVACEVATNMVPPLTLPSDDDGNDEKPTNDDNNNTANNLPSISYQAHHGNVCDTSKFNVPFVKQFDLVVNALDNVEARRRVNRLCLAADVPLIEAGTTGYLGQVTVIHKSSGVACYECTTQETQKVYPICTIRSTPSMPVHTIVWSKELYKLLFHSKVDDSMLYEDPEGEEPSTYMAAVSNLRKLLTNNNNSSSEEDKDGLLFSKAVRDVLYDLYSTEIQKQLDMGRYKAAKKTPTCLEASILEKGMTAITPPSSTTDIWSLEESVTALATCLREAQTTPNENLLEEFDKDDDMAMRFVTAASNLRSSVFGIEPLQSLYSAKGIAGNIIPAIATTNAICAGLQILQAFSILKRQLMLEQDRTSNGGKENGDGVTGLQLDKSCFYVNCIRNRTRNGLYLTAVPLEKPNPNCFVCKNAVIPLTLNVNEWTLQELLQRVIKGRLGFEEPTVREYLF